MTLPTSGAISLNGIHVEAGGTTFTTVSLNDADVRALNPASGNTINSTSGTAIDFGDFYGASAASPPLTSGTFNVAYSNVYNYQFSGFADGTSANDTIGTFSFQGTTSRIVSAGNQNGGAIMLIIKSTGGTDYWVNGNDWTTLNFYSGSNNSGTPALSLAKSAVSSTNISGNGTANVQVIYTWSGTYAISTYFGTSTSAGMFLEILL